MDEQPADSVESKLFLARLEGKRMYPFLRAIRWLIRAGVGVYLLTSAGLAIILLSEGVSQDMAKVIVAWGGPEKGVGVFAAFLFLVAVALRAALMLAVSEAIQLLLDLRATQLETSRPAS